MSEHPYCKYQNLEVGQCQLCGYLIKNNLEANSEHLLKECIPTLTKRFEDEKADRIKLQSIIQRIELQEANSDKLDQILNKLETDRKQTNQQFEKLSEIITELKSSSLQVKTKSSSIPTKAQAKILAIQNISSSVTEQSLPESNQTSENNIASEDDTSELLGQTDFQQSSPVNSSSFLTGTNHYNGFGNQSYFNNNNSLTNSNEPENSLYSPTGDRNLAQNFGSINEPQGSFYNNKSDRQIIETVTPQENNSKKRANSNNSYQSFYSLIERGELEVTKVAIPQETLEKVRSGTQSELKFINERKGNYWIVNWQGVYCLIPKEKLNINPYQYGNFQRVFNCQDYRESYEDFEVFEPATVTNCDCESWRLERKGTIKFI